MLTLPGRLGRRASASSRASSAGSVTDVWAVLSDPERWAQFDPFVGAVALEETTAVAGQHPAKYTVAEGQRWQVQLRLLPFRVPVTVEHVVQRSSLVVMARLLPGLSEEVEHLLVPQTSGGAMVTARITLHGPLALPALGSRWLLRSLTVRLLARAAEERLRGAAGISSVA